MFKRIILGAFTFWVGLSASIIVPTVGVQAELKLATSARAQISAEKTASATETCASLNTSAFQATKKTAANGVSVFRQRFSDMSNTIPQQVHVAVRAVVNKAAMETKNVLLSPDQYPIQDEVISVTTAQLQEGLGHIKNSANSNVSGSLDKYFEAIKQLGAAKCPQYSSEVASYNALVDDFNALAKSTFPQDAATFTKAATENLPGVTTIVGSQQRTKPNQMLIDSVGEAVTTFVSGEGKLNLATYKKLPTDASKLDPAMTPSNSDGDAGTTVIDPNANKLGELTGDPALKDDANSCGCKLATENTKADAGFWSFIPSWDDVLSLFCGMGCLVLSFLISIMVSSAKPADCQLLGDNAGDDCDVDSSVGGIGATEFDFENSSGGTFESDTPTTDSVIDETGAIGTSPVLPDEIRDSATNRSILLQP